MTHNNYKRLGDYIRQVDVRNKDLAVEKLLGLSIAKQFIPSIANTIGTDMRNYKVVEPGHTIISYQDLTLYNLERKEQISMSPLQSKFRDWLN